MPLLEAEILGRAASPSIHLMGLTHSVQNGKATQGHRLAGRNAGNKYWNGTLESPEGSEKQEGLWPVDEGQLGWDWKGKEELPVNSFGSFLP